MMKVTSKRGTPLTHEPALKKAVAHTFNIMTKKNEPVQFKTQMPSYEILPWVVSKLDKPLENCILIQLSNTTVNIKYEEVIKEFKFWDEYDYIADGMKNVLNEYEKSHTMFRQSIYVMGGNVLVVVEYTQVAPQIDSSLLVNAFGKQYKNHAIFSELKTVEGIASFLRGAQDKLIEEKFLEYLPIYEEAISTSTIAAKDKRLIVDVMPEPKLFCGFAYAVGKGILPEGLRKSWNTSAVDKVEEI